MRIVPEVYVPPERAEAETACTGYRAAAEITYSGA